MAYVMAVIGAGGKSSLIEALADALAEKGNRVAITTSTHIWKQEDRAGIHYIGQDLGDGKLGYPGDSVFEEICSSYDAVLVEADGSKHRPIKIPSASEPVIPSQTDEILLVMGLSALGRPFHTVCQRWMLADRASLQERFPEFREDMPVTEELIRFLAEEYYLKPLRERFPKIRTELLLSDMKRSGMEKRIGKFGMVLLASGFGQRFGSNKLLADWNGQAMWKHMQNRIQAAGRLLKDKMQNLEIEYYIVSRYPEILEDREMMEQKQLHCIENPDYAEGIAASVRYGAEAAFLDQCDAVAFFVADQPELREESICGMLCEYLYSGKAAACMYTDHPANPAVFDSSYREALQKLKGDRGAIRLLKEHPQKVHYYIVEEKELRDVDIPEALNE